MKIFSAAQIREADAYTIQHEPISSVDLMERAAAACTGWIEDHFPPAHPVYIICGKGNNGGDGLAIVRQLLEKGYEANAWLLTGNASADNLANQARLEQRFPGHIHPLNDVQEFPAIAADGIIIDALFGTGLNKPVEGWLAGVIHRINDLRTRHTVIAIDMPSGLQADSSSLHTPVVQAHYTLSFETYKLAFMLPENAVFGGEIHVLPIGLHPDFLTQTPARFHLTDQETIRTIYQPRNPFGHKGTYGHALLIAGSYGKIGAALLATRACLRAGAGLVSAHVPGCGYEIMQLGEPAAMCVTDADMQHSTHFHLDINEAKYNSIGIGPGLGTHQQTALALEKLLDNYPLPMVLDADALNIISVYPYLLYKIPKGSLLTPHPKEFERLFGATANQFERLDLLSRKSVETGLYILLKGRYSTIACPDGSLYFNPTGNAGMATGGSGDVLTGILTAMLAQGYTPKAAIILGVWLHGYAGDLAAARLSQEAMTAGDIIHHLGDAFLQGI
ncbi:NAD(P)H-hydrate epimerase [Chitinophaga jiangningensis]|uniref:Bifunctional NAD(P)H-hydrate repair enzyme n=1 Tax=Chitinophaga jiangningensis TaxID=1419482 RepID=A0A1M6YJN5_9BACT|nr:bifunctional ADP-dependent NAD(P)H-hydrate dehydratase/NAD(P)H-hydrate epimerase [Chitinophaga jiangningensis]SHL18282.1 NAD(P)H-hydrate epimerase [Chitinophaga jiangningensis]